MSGVLDTFRTRVPGLAAEVRAQLAVRADLQAGVERAYADALAETGEELRNGSLLRGEILARWQDFAGTGDLLRALQSSREGRSGRQARAARPGRSGREARAGQQHKQASPGRAEVLKAAVRAGIESLVVSVADRAAERCISRWRGNPAGAALLDTLSAAESDENWAGSQFAAGAGLLGLDMGTARGDGDAAGESAGPPWADASAGPPWASEGPPWASESAGPPWAGASALGRSSPDLGTRSGDAVGGWQDHVLHLVQTKNVTKRSIARIISFDNDSLSTVLVIGLLGSSAGDGAAAGGVNAVPQHLLNSLFGAGHLRDISTQAREDLQERIRLLFDEEMMRFAAVINAAGQLDGATAEHLQQAADSLEAAR